ncbi:cysteine desulfurase IscS [Paenibacillus marchantiophytorum]|uniref:Cysteine desulfurase IscS n=1 Tax=Paenibacillus marchantiophytorum TaxID=1619310 RepID=A0ABQ1F1U5_9BACL|nr:cysteine desulfurase family protein [Paenibacillus marchantiophytorum]GFZ96575.1 cysteine desulfurase IscS [Paenibacillus marchantiophytorum]
MIGRYFDYNSTTPLDPRVCQVITESMDIYGNPSSTHGSGQKARLAIHSARQHIAALLHGEPEELYITSGGSESNNWLLKGYLSQWAGTPVHVITSVIEHPSVKETLRYWRDAGGGEITYIPVDAEGFISPQAVMDAIRPDTKLISIMLANNETGAIQPVQEIARIAGSRGIFTHTDAVQAVGKMPIHVRELGVDSLSFSIHKLYGPKGIGGLYLQSGYKLDPLLHGGGQEQGLRSGTENVLSLLGAAEACRVAMLDMERSQVKLLWCKRLLVEKLRAIAPGLKINGSLDSDRTLANTVNLCIPGIRGEALAAYLDHRYGIAVSVGSACSSNHQKKLSYVLQEMGLDEADIRSSLRISMGKFTDEMDIHYLLESIESALAHFNQLMPT